MTNLEIRAHARDLKRAAYALSADDFAAHADSVLAALGGDFGDVAHMACGLIDVGNYDRELERSAHEITGEPQINSAILKSMLAKLCITKSSIL